MYGKQVRGIDSDFVIDAEGCRAGARQRGLAGRARSITVWVPSAKPSRRCSSAGDNSPRRGDSVAG